MGKTHFWPKKHFSAKRKNGCFSVIQPEPGRLSIWVIFLWPTHFHQVSLKRSKIKGTYNIPKWEWPETAKNRGDLQKMTHSWETEIFTRPILPFGDFLGGSPNGKVVSSPTRIFGPESAKKMAFVIRRQTPPPRPGRSGEGGGQ